MLTSAFVASSRNSIPARPRNACSSARAAFNERAHDRPRARVDPAQSARTRAANQPQQKRLGLIVAGVADGDAIGAQPAGRAGEERVARVVRGAFDATLRDSRAIRPTSAASTSMGRECSDARRRQNASSSSASRPRRP